MRSKGKTQRSDEKELLMGNLPMYKHRRNANFSGHLFPQLLSSFP
ncbi:hypothetical protein T4D_14036 [Trichinella pseudospiralis]|uniref:Uncharacterized protein n=1 Tax=Trichinella pseudospiralis TaxID=6337 RepID=A0A0V1F2R0_TRIPS|nr:hypothetical protein T4D_14036 [Trichinella pseudospiralis]